MAGAVICRGTWYVREGRGQAQPRTYRFRGAHGPQMSHRAESVGVPMVGGLGWKEVS